MTGWTFDELDAASARRCDWLLAIHGVHQAVAAQQASAATGGPP